MTLTNLSYFSLLAIVFCITTTIFETHLLRPPHNRRHHPLGVCAYHFKAQSTPPTLSGYPYTVFWRMFSYHWRTWRWSILGLLARGFTRGASTKSDTLLRLRSCRFLVVQERFPSAL